jgi:hypothetical protein
MHARSNLFVGIGKYWLTPFRLDGFGFDQVMGFDNPKFPTKGAPQLIGTPKKYASSQGLENISRFSRGTVSSA